MRTVTPFGLVGLVASLHGCGSSPTSFSSTEEPAHVTEETEHADRSHGTQGCADHTAEFDTVEARLMASKAVSWKAPGTALTNRTVEVRILGFNDFHGQLGEGRRVSNRPVGGAAVLASYLKAAQVGFEDRNLIIHAGDHVGATPPESALLQDEPSIQFLNLLANARCVGPADDDKACNVVGTLGNHEFDEGKDELLRLLNGGNHANGPFLVDPYPGARFPYVNANVLVEKPSGRTKPLIKPYVVRRLDGVRVGVVGAVLKETPTIVTPAGVSGLSFLDEATMINAQVAELRSRGVHSIVVTIHQGASQTSYTTPTDPAATVGAPISTIVSQLDDEVDVVISGHAHSFTNALVTNGNGHQILVVQAFSSSTAYDEIDLVIDRATGDVVNKSARVVTTYSDQTPGNARDPEVQTLVDRAVAATAPLVNQPVATFTADITRTQSAAGESALGNLIADAQRAAMGTDFAFMNPGGIRADLLFAATPGNAADANGLALWGELFTIQPFGNSLVRMNMTGQQIYDLLNQQFTVNRFLQISGLSYTWDAALPAASRVVEVQKDGVPIDIAQTYTVTANNFIATGGDGFTVFLGGTGNVGGPIDLDAFIAHVTALPQPFSAPVVDRITRLN
jgi:5'-nucleotidase